MDTKQSLQIVGLLIVFEKPGSVDRHRPYQYARSVPNRDNTATVSENVRQGPTTSTRRRSPQSALRDTALRRILYTDLYLHIYKNPINSKLKPTDHQQRRILLIRCLKVETDFPPLWFFC